MVIRQLQNLACIGEIRVGALAGRCLHERAELLGPPVHLGSRVERTPEVAEADPQGLALGREYVRQGFTPPVRSWELAIAHFNALSGTRVRHERRIARDALAIELPEHRVEVSPVAVRVEPHRWVELH